MVRAIAFLALLEAARDGASRASFRRFQVRATRVARAGAAVHVELCVSFGARLLQRSVIALHDDEFPDFAKQHADGIDAGDVELFLYGAVIGDRTTLYRSPGM